MTTNENDAVERAEEHTRWLEAELFRIGAMHTELGSHLASALDNAYAASVPLRDGMDAATDAERKEFFKIPLIQTLTAAKEIVDGLMLGGIELQKEAADRVLFLEKAITEELARIRDKLGA